MTGAISDEQDRPPEHDSFPFDMHVASLTAFAPVIRAG